MTSFSETRLERAAAADLARGRRPVVSWRRLAKFGFSAALLFTGMLILYQQLVLRVSREAVINARLAVIRAPIDGVATASLTTPGAAVDTGAPLGSVVDPLADNARLLTLQREANDLELRRATLAAELADLEQARTEAKTQAEAYRVGRVKELELRVDEARADLAAAEERLSETAADTARGATLRAQGFQSDQAQDKLRHQQEIDRQNVTAVRKRLDALTVELDAARSGTFLGDSYNDAPSSLQRARELTLRIAETRTAIAAEMRRADTVRSTLAEERQRLAAHSRAVLTAPVSGRLWTVHAAPGEYVRKGQEVLSVLDCSSVVVTADVSERDYNRLKLGEPVHFRVSGSDRAYSGDIVKLGPSAAFAIPPAAGDHQIVVALSDMPAASPDSCAVGRSGEITFGGRSRIANHLLDALRRLFGLA